MNSFEEILTLSGYIKMKCGNTLIRMKQRCLRILLGVMKISLFEESRHEDQDFCSTIKSLFFLEHIGYFHPPLPCFIDMAPGRHFDSLLYGFTNKYPVLDADRLHPHLQPLQFPIDICCSHLLTNLDAMQFSADVCNEVTLGVTRFEEKNIRRYPAQMGEHKVFKILSSVGRR